MTKLHELLAAEKTTIASWNALFEDTLKKFKAPAHFFEGHSKSLRMIEENAQNDATVAMAREEKAVPTNVYDTLEYAFEIFGKAERLQFQKNEANRVATGTVMWRGAVLFDSLPCDQLLGLEARLTRIKLLLAEIPTLDATKHWEFDVATGNRIFKTVHPEETTKTEKQTVALTLAPATNIHPAQTDKISRDVVVGLFTTIKRSGAVTAYQKSEALKRVDELLVEIKQARMRANETLAEESGAAHAARLVELLLEPLK